VTSPGTHSTTTSATRDDDRRIRALRGAKPNVDPWRPHGSTIDVERRADGRLERALTIFLAGAECPYTCSFCDLWRYTLHGPTPLGALPAQIEHALASLDGPPVDRMKLYNASNFFDRRAVPADDMPRIAELCAFFAGVTVESHARTIGAMTLDFARLLPRRAALEVAVGLETIHPEAMARLNKRLDLPSFDTAARFLADHEIALRTFVLLGTPHIPRDEQSDWTVRTVEYAASRGAAIVAIIPVRGGNGELERLAMLGQFAPPTLRELEATFDRCVGAARTVVTVDVWDVERLAACAHCRTRRIDRLRRMNQTGCAEPSVHCEICNDS
jgi:uncharacterized Fe-S cluster-containing MiaB family protein